MVTGRPAQWSGRANPWGRVEVDWEAMVSVASQSFQQTLEKAGAHV